MRLHILIPKFDKLEPTLETGRRTAYLHGWEEGKREREKGGKGKGETEKVGLQ